MTAFRVFLSMLHHRLAIKPVDGGSNPSQTTVVVRCTEADGSTPVEGVRIALTAAKGALVSEGKEIWGPSVEGTTDSSGIARFVYSAERWTRATPGDAVIEAIAIFEGGTERTSATVNIVGPPAFITMTAAPSSLITGEAATIVTKIVDAIGQNVPDGTILEFATNPGGILAPAYARAFNGVAITYLLTSEVHSGNYTVVAITEDDALAGSLTCHVSVNVSRVAPSRSASDELISMMVNQNPQLVHEPVSESIPGLSDLSDHRSEKTILFTDIVGSTSLQVELGDEPYAELRREHDNLLQHLIAEHRGTVVTNGGDSFYCVFDQARDAVGTAIAIQRALADYRRARPNEPRGRIRVRMGIHSGEVGAEDKNYFGATVNIAHRVMSRAEGSQILVSEATRLILRGHQEFEFVDPDTFEPRGETISLTVHTVVWMHTP